MKRAWLVAAIPVFVVSCTGGSGEDRSADRVPLPEDLPACSELFQEGTPVDLEKFGRACRNESEELEVPRYANVECSDGVHLVWNKFAWGYDKEPMHLFAVDDPIKIPTDQVDKCQAGAGATPTTAP